MAENKFKLNLNDDEKYNLNEFLQSESYPIVLKILQNDLLNLQKRALIETNVDGSAEKTNELMLRKAEIQGAQKLINLFIELKKSGSKND